MRRNGDDVRKDDPDDRIYRATREHWLAPNILLHPNDVVRYNGKSIVYRPCGYDPSVDAETDDVAAFECALRRGWLKLVGKQGLPLMVSNKKWQCIINRQVGQAKTIMQNAFKIFGE